MRLFRLVSEKMYSLFYVACACTQNWNEKFCKIFSFQFFLFSALVKLYFNEVIKAALSNYMQIKLVFTKFFIVLRVLKKENESDDIISSTTRNWLIGSSRSISIQKKNIDNSAFKSAEHPARLEPEGKKSSVKPGSAAKLTVSRKRNTYKDIIDQNYFFIPLTVETLKPWCVEAVDIVHSLGSRIAHCTKLCLVHNHSML